METDRPGPGIRIDFGPFTSSNVAVAPAGTASTRNGPWHHRRTTAADAVPLCVEAGAPSDGPWWFAVVPAGVTCLDCREWMHA